MYIVNVENEQKPNYIMENLELINPIDIKLSKDGHGEFPNTYVLTDIGFNKLKQEFINLLHEAYSNAQTTMITTMEEKCYFDGCESLRTELKRLIEEE